MNPVLKWLGITVTVILLLIGAATLLVSRLIDEAQLKITLLEVANRNLDGTLSINGELSLSVFPRLELTARDVHLRTPAGAAEDFASIREIGLGMDLMPLLRRQVSVDRLVLKGLSLNAHRNKTGKANWEALTGTPAGKQPPTSSNRVAAAAATPLLLAIERVRIEDGLLSFIDEQAGTHLELRDIRLGSDALNMHGRPFKLEGDARLLVDGGKHNIGFEFATLARFDHDNGLVALEKSRLAVTPADGHAFELSAPDVHAQLNEHNVQIPALSLSAAPVQAEASLVADWSRPEERVFNGKLDVKALDLPALLKALAITLPPGLNPEPLADVALRTDYTLRGDMLSLPALKLRAGQFAAEGELKLGTGKTKRIDARITSPELDLEYIFPPTEIPPAQPGEIAIAAPAAGPGALLSFDGSIDASLGRLRTSSLELSDVESRLILEQGQARLERLSARLYGGTLNATGTLDVRNTGALGVKAELGSVDLGALLKATKDLDRMQGRIDGSLDLAAIGQDMAAWKASLHGPVRLKIGDPVLNGLSVEEVICKAAAQLNQEALGASFAPLTRFRSIDTGLDFAAGVGTLHNFNASVPSMALRGEGKLDLAREKLDIQLNARVTDDLEKLDPACRMTRKMLAVEWPISCKGSFDEDPKDWCGIDRDDIAKIASQLATDKVKNKLMDKLGDFFKRGN